MADVVDSSVRKRRLYIRKAGYDRVRFELEDDPGGSYLIFVEYLKDLLDGKLLQAYAVQVEDSDEWKRKKAGGKGSADSMGRSEGFSRDTRSGAKPRDADAQVQDEHVVGGVGSE